MARRHIMLGIAIFLLISTTTLTSASLGELWGIRGTHIYNKNPGYVGIGTDRPETTLDVAGAVHIRDHLQVGTRGPELPLTPALFDIAGAAALQYYSPIARISATEGNSALAVSRGDEEDASQLFLGYVDVGWVIEDVGSEHRLDVGDGVGPILSILPTDEAAGNVGIGITQPTATLHVAGSIRIDGDEGGEEGSITLTDTIQSSDTFTLPEHNNPTHWLKLYVDDEAYYLPLYKELSVFLDD